MPPRDISDKELNRRCIIAIKKGMSREAFYMKMKAERRRVGQTRIYRVWKALDGPIQPRRTDIHCKVLGCKNSPRKEVDGRVLLCEEHAEEYKDWAEHDWR
jgi:hypothetical protein